MAWEFKADDVRQFKLPLPTRDMLPITIEEQLICYADSFFSKNGNNGKNAKEKTVKQILRGLKRYGTDKVQRFWSSKAVTWPRVRELPSMAKDAWMVWMRFLRLSCGPGWIRFTPSS